MTSGQHEAVTVDPRGVVGVVRPAATVLRLTYSRCVAARAHGHYSRVLVRQAAAAHLLAEEDSTNLSAAKGQAHVARRGLLDRIHGKATRLVSRLPNLRAGERTATRNTIGSALQIGVSHLALVARAGMGRRAFARATGCATTASVVCIETAERAGAEMRAGIEPALKPLTATRPAASIVRVSEQKNCASGQGTTRLTPQTAVRAQCSRRLWRMAQCRGDRETAGVLG